jgi:hypothetical protein
MVPRWEICGVLLLAAEMGVSRPWLQWPAKSAMIDCARIVIDYEQF